MAITSGELANLIFSNEEVSKDIVKFIMTSVSPFSLADAGHFRIFLRDINNLDVE